MKSDTKSGKLSPKGLSKDKVNYLAALRMAQMSLEKRMQSLEPFFQDIGTWIDKGEKRGTFFHLQDLSAIREYNS